MAEIKSGHGQGGLKWGVYGLAWERIKVGDLQRGELNFARWDPVTSGAEEDEEWGQCQVGSQRGKGWGGHL